MTGQGHMDYPPNTYILPVMSSAIFPPKFYIDAFEKGFDAITVMYSGTDSPYKGESEKTAEIVNQTNDKMKELNLDPRRPPVPVSQPPGFSAAVVGVLARGMGATAAMFSAGDAALLRPLPFAEPDRRVLIRDINIPYQPAPGAPEPPETNVVNYPAVASGATAFSTTAVYAGGGLNRTGPGEPGRINVGVVTPRFFATLGVRPTQGRPFTTDEGVPGGADVAILSYGLWRGRFGGTPMLGKRVTLNRSDYTVVGIMPPGFTFPARSALWIPLTVPSTPATFQPFRGFLPSHVIARLADGVSVAAANQQVIALWSEIANAGTARYAAEELERLRAAGAVTSLQRDLVGDQRSALLVLLGATGFLLLIGCINVTNLLLSRAAGRRREIALRATLGATRGRLVRQLLIESVVLALAGAVAGVAPAARAAPSVRTAA